MDLSQTNLIFYLLVCHKFLQSSATVYEDGENDERPDRLVVDFDKDVNTTDSKI